MSPSSVYSPKELKIVATTNIANPSDLQIKSGDKILVLEKFQTRNQYIVIRQILARDQPIASSTYEYLKKLRINVDDKNQRLDLQEINDILQNVLGITVEKAGTDSKNHHILIRVADPDPGTRLCPFLFLVGKSSFPFEIAFPKTSEETKEYLKKVYSDDKRITDTRIFAFRLVHFLRHISGYQEHPCTSAPEDKRLADAIKQGNPNLVPPFDVKKFCLGDWQSAHFIAVDPDLSLDQINGMICEECRKNRLPILPSFEDLNILLGETKPGLKTEPLKQKSKGIYYVLGKNKKGIILSSFPYVSDNVVDFGSIDWSPINELGQNMYSFFVPKALFSSEQDMRKGDKILAEIDVEMHFEGKPLGSCYHQARRITAIDVLSRRVGIIDPHSLLYRLKPFRLTIVLKIGPGIDDAYIQKVASFVRQMTDWRVRIDKSAYADLGRSYEEMSNIYREWKESNSLDRGKLIARVNDTMKGLARIKDVEDRFEITVFIFPDNLKFVEDIMGDTFSGEAIWHMFAVVHTWPKAYHPGGKEFCKACVAQFHYPFGEALTSLLVVHEVMHISSGLGDHHDCSVCTYNQREMHPFRRFRCEECIRKHENASAQNCLMSYRCLECIASRIPEEKLSDLLCEECGRKLFPQDQFAVRQARRMNSMIYLDRILN